MSSDPYGRCHLGSSPEYDGVSCWTKPNSFGHIFPEKKDKVCRCAQVYAQLNPRREYGYILPGPHEVLIDGSPIDG